MNRERTAYTMAVNNVAAYIKGPENAAAAARNDGSAMTAFEASAVLGVAFCKAKEEVMGDILRAEVV
jgi:hypothetical protein